MGLGACPGADFTELVDLAKETGLTVLLCGDNDELGRKAMRKVSTLLKIDHHLDTTDLAGPEKGGSVADLAVPEKGGSVADLPADDLQALLRIQLSDWDLNWQKPIRTRKQYLEYKCPRPKKYLKGSGDGGEIWGLVSCEKTATCRECVAWEAFLHIERCWRGKPAMMIRVSGFGEVGSTIAETVGAAKVYRGHFEGRLRKNSYVGRNEENNHSSERRKFMTALALGR